MLIKTYQVLGLMSGSSLDGLDIALCEFQIEAAVVKEWHLVKAETFPFTAAWQQKLRELPHLSSLELLTAHTHFGHYMGQLVNEFLEKHQLRPDFIASHGHTVFHFPNRQMTLQIGDGAALAAATGYPVVCDFRAMDIALGGQGAPLAPIADQLLLKGYDFYLNLGGIANISCNANDTFIAFDIGGANQVLNVLAQQAGFDFDPNGRLAESGNLSLDLLQKVNALPYFQQDYPKSLGNDWVQEQLIPIYLSFEAPVQDKLHTACVQLAKQLASDIQTIIRREQFSKSSYRLLATGGGAHNRFLVQCIREASQENGNFEIEVPQPEMISFKEAALIALMGTLRVENIPNCMASVTGAAHDAIGGAIHQGRLKIL